MRTGFVKRIGPYDVERISGVVRTFSPVDLSAPPVCVWHTTEGSWPSAIAVYRSKLATPTLQIDRRRIGQMIPFGEMAAALKNPPGGFETNRLARVQIEVVGYSKTSPWIFDDDLLDVAAHVAAFLEDQLEIPIRRPWSGTDLGPLPWATPSYPRRRSGKWGRQAGWFGHVEVPENDHWDPGELRYPVLLEAAKKIGRPRTLRLVDPPMRGADVVSAKKLLRSNRFANFGPKNVDDMWGMEAAQATHRAKYWLGYPGDGINVVFGPTIRRYLEGRELPDEYRSRRRARLRRVQGRVPAFDDDRSVHENPEAKK